MMKSLKEIELEMHSLGWWYQHFQFPCGLRTGDGQEPGYDAQARWNLFAPFVPQDLSGKTVLDLGGNAGFFSIQMKRRGALRCVLVDPFEEFLKQARFASQQFQVELDLVNDDAHTYCLTTEERFDYVIFVGLLYHLKYPGLVLDRLAEMTRERMFLHSHLLGSSESTYVVKENYERGKEDELLEDPAFPKLVFIENLYYGDSTNWWIPNYHGLEALVRSAGMKVVGRPHPHLLVAEPEIYFGKAVYPKLVFPKYGKKEGGRFPGPQTYDSELWNDLIRRSRKPGEDETTGK
jgi:tRNA (mo5U34)-methyltransferase